jgi:hypothetical protein
MGKNVMEVCVERKLSTSPERKRRISNRTAYQNKRRRSWPLLGIVPERTIIKWRNINWEVD